MAPVLTWNDISRGESTIHIPGTEPEPEPLYRSGEWRHGHRRAYRIYRASCTHLVSAIERYIHFDNVPYHAALQYMHCWRSAVFSLFRIGAGLGWDDILGVDWHGLEWIWHGMEWEVDIQVGTVAWYGVGWHGRVV